MKRIFVHNGNEVVEISQRQKEVLPVRPFEPYYDPVLRTEVSSSRELEKKMKKLKNYSHPEGLSPINDDKTFLKECKDIRENRMDYFKKTYGEQYLKHKMETNKAFREKITRPSRRYF